MGKLQEAVRSYRKVLKINPDHETAKKNLAFVLREIKRRKKDKKDTEKRRKKNQQNQQQKKQDQNKDQKGQGSEKQQHKNESSDKKRGDKKKKPEKNKKKDGGTSAQKKDNKAEEVKSKEPQKYVPYKMSEEEARKWLNSLNERDAKKKHRKRLLPGSVYRNEKDW